MAMKVIASEPSVFCPWLTACTNGIDSSRANGTVKWNRTIRIATQPKLPRMRGRKKEISSGRLPAQVISHWEYEK